MHTICLTNGWSLTKLAQIHHQDGGGGGGGAGGGGRGGGRGGGGGRVCVCVCVGGGERSGPTNHGRIPQDIARHLYLL